MKFYTSTMSVLLAIFVFSSTAWSAPAVGCYGGWQAVWSPDGKQIAFVSGFPHSSSNIWVIGADGSGATQITTRGGTSPIWSPDGKEVIFQADRGQGPRYYFRPLSGTDDKLFERLPAGSSSAVWSPDGKKIVYTHAAEGKQKTYVVDLASGEKRELKYEFSARDYAWSPDGKKLAVITGEVVGDSLLQYDLATDKLQHVYHGYCSAPAFSPDSTVLTFAAPIGKNRHKLLAVVPENKGEKKFNVVDFDGKSLVWSKNGKKLLFASSTSQQLSRLWTVGSDGKKLTPLKSTYKWAGNPHYSPSGDSILFEAVAKGGYGSDIYLCRADGSNTRRLTTSDVSYWQPKWIGPGKLAVMTDSGARGQILAVDINQATSPNQISGFDLGKRCRVLSSPTGGQIALVQEGQVAVVQLDAKTPTAKVVVSSPFPTAISWSPDGKRIYYTDVKGKGLGICAVDIDGKNVAQLTPAPQTAQTDATAAGTTQAQTTSIDICPAVSPDGKTVAFVRGTDVWTVGADGANEHLLAKLEIGQNDAVAYPTWSSDGSFILLQVQRILPEGISSELWTVQSDGSDAKRVYHKMVDNQFDAYGYDSTNPAQIMSDSKSAITTLVGSPGLPELWLIDLANGQAKQLTETGGTFPSLAPDGKTVAYTSFAGGREGLSILDLTTLKSRNLELKR